MVKLKNKNSPKTIVELCFHLIFSKVEMFKEKITKLLFKNYHYQTFTFFIPSPPQRKSGYREKEFDKLFFQFLSNYNYEPISIQLSSQSGQKSSGMWIVCLARSSQIKDPLELNLELEFPNLFETSDNDDNLRIVNFDE